MSILSKFKKKDDTTRLSVTISVPTMRNIDGFRLYAQKNGAGYLPTRAEVIENGLAFTFGEDKVFPKFLKDGGAALQAEIDALQSAEAKGDDKPIATPVKPTATAATQAQVIPVVTPVTRAAQTTTATSPSTTEAVTSTTTAQGTSQRPYGTQN
ncbi:hypothetical protein [Massilia sp. 9096]|uniref:hypothetical protein n=1 Tax=Massilia sp. 9096 TaxID=1500894 RepID=UPI00055B4DC4|nr:hypothetical protein [Massilia sp. 9096]